MRKKALPMYPTDSQGWSALPRAADANVVQVPKGTGPLSSVVKAKTVAGKQNVFLLERGGTWDDYMVPVPSGQPNLPTVFGSYGTGTQRPVIRSDAAFANKASDPKSWIALYRLELVGKGKQAGDGIGLMNSKNVLIEDCVIREFQNGITFQGGQSLWLRRSSVLDCYAVNPAMRSQGLYVGETQGLLVEDCFFDHCGWKKPGSDTLENHNIYVNGACSAVTVRGLVSSSASSHGLQMRAGGGLYDYLSLFNPIGLSYGLVLGDGPKVAGGVSGTVTGVTVVGGRDIAGQRRGIGIQAGNVLKARFVNVMALDKPDQTWPVFWFDQCSGAGMEKTVGIIDLKVVSMLQSKWNGGAFKKTPAISAGDGKTRKTMAPISVTGLEGTGVTVPTAVVTNQNYRDPARPDWGALVTRLRARGAGQWDVRDTPFAVNAELWRQQ